MTWRSGSVVAALFAALAVAVLPIAYLAYARSRERFLAIKADELSAIADVKVSDLVAWRSERLADARVVARDPLLGAAVRTWFASGVRAEVSQDLGARLDSLSDIYGYRLSLLDAEGKVRFTSPPAMLAGADQDELAQQARACTGADPCFVDLHQARTGDAIHLEIVSPLRVDPDPRSRPIAFVELLVDPWDSLYPRLRFWPTASPSGETLVVRREGEHVVFLSPLRHRAGAPLSLRMPLSRPDFPAAQAVQGKEGVVEGRDYRNRRVMTALRHVPDSPWFLVTKVDHDEIMAPLVRDTWLIASLALSLIALAGVGALRFWRRERQNLDAGLREAEARNRALFENSPSGVALHRIVLDEQGRAVDYVFLDVNDAFETLTGLRRELVLGRRVTEVLPGIEKEPFIETYGRVVATGKPVHFEHTAASLGRHYDIVAFPVGDGQFATVFRDVTEARSVAERSRLQAAALGAAANAVMITDREGRIVWCNDAFAKLTGWSLEQCQGLTPRILKSGRYDQQFYAQVWRAILSGQVWHRQMVNRHKDGGLYVEDQTITPVLGEGGEVTHFVAIKIDVSERTRNEEALRQSEARYRALAEAAQDDIFIVGRSGRVHYLNARAASRIGLRPDQIGSRSLEELFPAAVSERLQRNIQRALAEKRPIYDEGPVPLPGRTVWLGTWLVPLEDAGSEPQVMGVSRDVTSQKEAQQALAHSEARYRSLFENSLAAVYRTSEEGRILECNDAFARILGYDSREAVRAVGAAALYPTAGDRERFLDRLRSEGTLVNFEHQARGADGRLLWLLENASWVPPERCEAGGVIEGTFVDVTTRRNLEDELRQSQKLYGLGQLAGGMAHDFNNLLGVIIGYSELAQRQLGPDHPARPRVDQILNAAGRAADLTHQLLAFSRRQVLQPKVLAVNVLIEDARRMLRRLIGEDVQVAVQLAPDLGLVEADPGQLHQVIMNLAVNARDAMPAGGTLTLETENVVLDDAEAAAHSPAPAPGRYVLLAVSDTGVGMDAETQAHVFEPFFTTKPAGTGTGLGLATVYGIVKQSNGYIWLYSEPGHGTTFKVYLPRVDEAADVEPLAAPSALGGHETILLVEDTERLREVVCETLEELGYTVLVASDGQQALRLVEDRQPVIDLLLTDVIMPKVGGGELARRLRALCPGLRVLYMSGYTDGAISRQGVLSPGHLLLQKPFTTAALARAVRHALDRPTEDR